MVNDGHTSKEQFHVLHCKAGIITDKHCVCFYIRLFSIAVYLNKGRPCNRQILSCYIILPISYTNENNISKSKSKSNDMGSLVCYNIDHALVCHIRNVDHDVWMLVSR